MSEQRNSRPSVSGLVLESESAPKDAVSELRREFQEAIGSGPNPLAPEGSRERDGWGVIGSLIRLESDITALRIQIESHRRYEQRESRKRTALTSSMAAVGTAIALKLAETLIPTTQANADRPIEYPTFIEQQTRGMK